MKRDMDLIRDILLQIEKQDINISQYEPIAVEGHTPMEVMQACEADGTTWAC